MPAKVMELVNEEEIIAAAKEKGKIVLTRAGSVEWVTRCPAVKYAPVLSSMRTKIKGYGLTQVGDELWVCGGQGSWSYTCQILSLVDGKWRTFEHNMNISRIRPWMVLEGRKILVMGGTTSNVNSRTGCRGTQEVFDIDKPEDGWVTEEIEEHRICEGSSGNSIIQCPLKI